MGFIKKKPKPVEAAPVVAKPVEEPAATASTGAAAEEERKRRALLAINAGGDEPAKLGISKAANVTKRALLGL